MHDIELLFLGLELSNPFSSLIFLDFTCNGRTKTTNYFSPFALGAIHNAVGFSLISGFPSMSLPSLHVYKRRRSVTMFFVCAKGGMKDIQQ